MSTYRLPPELLVQIISNLGPNLVQYAIISRGWQVAIERQTFVHIKLDTPKRLAQFHELVAQNKRRRSYVRTVEVAVRLEAYSVEARAHFETIEEQARNNEIFVHWLRTVLGSLALWSDTDRADVELWIEAQSPSDVADRQRKKDARMDPETDILYHRFEHSYLHLSKNALEDLAPVNAVGTLLMKRQQRLISPASCSYLAVKLPRLQKMQLKLGDDEKRDSQLRKRNREEFSNSFHLWPTSVRQLWLEFPRFAPRNERIVPENILDGANFDLFSVRLRDLSQQLTTIYLKGMVGRELFWPLEAAEDSETTLPYWPNLTNYTIFLSGTTPAGEWFFEDIPDDEDDEPYQTTNSWQDLSERLWPAVEDRDCFIFRKKATTALLRDIYVSAGHAAQRMPWLQHMEIKCFSNHALHEFGYIVDGHSASATWTGSIKAELEEEVFRAWEDAAFQHTGVENGIQFGWKVLDTVEPIR